MKKIILYFKDHLLTLTLGISAIIQIAILLLFHFDVGSETSKKYIPMTITPFVEAMQKVKVVKKEIEETDEAEDEAIDKPDDSQKSVAQDSKQTNFLPFVRVDQIAKAKTKLVPTYPEIARSAGVEGTVILEAYIDEQGIVRKVVLKKGIGFGCDEAAIQKIKSTRFMPATMNGKPVAIRQIFTFDFGLTN